MHASSISKRQIIGELIPDSTEVCGKFQLQNEIFSFSYAAEDRGVGQHGAQYILSVCSSSFSDLLTISRRGQLRA